MGISYFNEYRDSGGVIVSVDMVTVDGKFYGRPEDVETRFFNCVRDCLWNYTTWISYKLGSYRYQYSVECEDGCSFWFGLGLIPLPTVSLCRVPVGVLNLIRTRFFGNLLF